MSSDCLFCRIVAGEIPASIVYETSNTVAFRDIKPSAPVHVLIAPKAHISDAVELAVTAPGTLDEIFRAAGEIAKLEGVDERGYRMLFNIGPDAGQTIFHAHLHVMGGQPLAPLG